MMFRLDASSSHDPCVVKTNGALGDEIDTTSAKLESGYG